jgi:hypothetical protein
MVSTKEINKIMNFLSKYGFDVMYHEEDKKIDGVLGREITEGEITYQIVIDFVENEVSFRVIAETEGIHEIERVKKFEGLSDLCKVIKEIMEWYGIEILWYS